MVIDVFTRRIVGFGIGGEYIDGPIVCRMFDQAIAGHAPPVRISTDHDPLFRFHRWLANLRILEVEEIKSVLYVPTSHPFMGRLIRTIRRKYLDHMRRSHSSEPCRESFIAEGKPGALCLGTQLQWAIRNSRCRLIGNSPSTGGSYGGFMNMWAVTQTDRFKAAVAAAGLSNWQSYYGENGSDSRMLVDFGASVYDDPAIYARFSPINYSRNVHTPTFAFTGERDIECPAAQTQEF